MSDIVRRRSGTPEAIPGSAFVGAPSNVFGEKLPNSAALTVYGVFPDAVMDFVITRLRDVSSPWAEGQLAPVTATAATGPSNATAAKATSCLMLSEMRRRSAAESAARSCPSQAPTVQCSLHQLIVGPINHVAM